MATVEVTFFHSAICPRCHLSGIALGKVIVNYPDVVVTRVEFLTNRDRARDAGVRSIPALVAGGQTLTGIVLTARRIDDFLSKVASTARPE